MSIEIHGVTEKGIAYREARGLGKCFKAYAYNAPKEAIVEIGLNPNSGYIYIALENGISICSMLGRKVEYLVTNLDNEEEVFLDNYDDAVNYNNDKGEEV